jgi:hypothetical protein
MIENTQAVARASGIDLRFHAVRNTPDPDGALAAIGKDAPDALLIMPSPLSLFERQKIGAFLSQRRLPTMA